MDWKPEYSVGEGRLDADHREIFEIVNEFRYHVLADFGYQVADTDAGFLELVIEELQKYTGHHFAQEEAHMRKMGYPKLDEHISIHAEMNNKLAQIHDQLHEGNTELVKEVSEFLNHWWSDHILQQDMAYHDYAKSQE